MKHTTVVIITIIVLICIIMSGCIHASPLDIQDIDPKPDTPTEEVLPTKEYDKGLAVQDDISDILEAYFKMRSKDFSRSSSENMIPEAESSFYSEEMKQEIALRCDGMIRHVSGLKETSWTVTATDTYYYVHSVEEKDDTITLNVFEGIVYSYLNSLGNPHQSYNGLYHKMSFVYIDKKPVLSQDLYAEENTMTFKGFYSFSDEGLTELIKQITKEIK